MVKFNDHKNQKKKIAASPKSFGYISYDNHKRLKTFQIIYNNYQKLEKRALHRSSKITINPALDKCIGFVSDF